MGRIHLKKLVDARASTACYVFEMNELNPLIELCRKIVADRVLTSDETRGLSAWLEAHPEFRSRWPGNVLHDRLTEILADGVLTEDELLNLGIVIDQISDLSTHGDFQLPGGAELPLDHPEPDVVFRNKRFSFLGDFVIGPAEQCFAAIRRLGGYAEPSLSQSTDYLVLGAVNATNLLEGEYADILHRAKVAKRMGQTLAIISEKSWARAFEMPDGPPAKPAIVEIDPPRIVLPPRRVEITEADGTTVEVDLGSVSCTCNEWMERRQTYPPGHIGCICRHLAEAIENSGFIRQCPPWTPPLLEKWKKRDRRAIPGSRLAVLTVDADEILVVAESPEWASVFAPSPAGPYERYNFHLNEQRWAYRVRPGQSESIAAVLGPSFYSS